MIKALNYFTLLAVLLLTACGDGDSNPPSGGQTGGSNDKPPFLIEAGYLGAYGAIAVNLPEGMLQLAHYSHTLVHQQVPFGGFQICSNGGGRTLSLSQPLPIASGTVFTDTLEDCFVETLYSILNGEIKLTINQHNSTALGHSYSLELDLSKVVFRDYPELTVLDTVSITLSTEQLLRTMVVRPTHNQVRFHFSDGDVFSLSQFQLTSKLDLATAMYRADYQGRIALNHFSHDLAISTMEPLQGYLGEYPHQGQIELSDSRNNKLLLTANQVVDSELVKVQLNQGATALYYWNEFTDGTYWSWPGLYSPGAAQRFRHDNFDFLGSVGTTSFNDFPSLGTLSFLFSRPVASVDGYALGSFFNHSVWGQPSVASEVAIEGAMVHIRPKIALTPGDIYTLESFGAVNTLGMNRYVYSDIQLTISTAVHAKVAKDRLSVQPGSELVLSAANSIIATGLAASYHWQELTDFGVTFTQNNTKETSIHIPVGSTPGIIRIRLTVEDELGRSHSTDAELLLKDTSTNVLYYNSEQGDWIGGGQTRFLTNMSGQLTSSSWDRNTLTVEYSGTEHNRSVWWYLSLAAPEGKDLTPGLYQNATRAAFKPAHGNGLDFTGNGRGCNTLIGSFEIFDIEFTEFTNEWGEQQFDVSTLAVDFTQYCEGGESALHGKVRINSSHPM
ncbi:hypothetical protein [Alkalimonas amylolytica]|uniref:Uncharacterized protein n=1 Tax=Alkalimonas amylolytica TaxID=152573 RepID=A0A1H3X6T3_ALKAM|nr:hypothetical protein [Alkalimonas amylolytica]SDZ94950.1 hypothetical protein SAMN04488051_101123 [Alkalimonas amylolytica]